MTKEKEICESTKNAYIARRILGSNRVPLSHVIIRIYFILSLILQSFDSTILMAFEVNHTIERKMGLSILYTPAWPCRVRYEKLKDM